MNKQVILFDGVCNLCNGFVQFVIKRDRQAHFLFGSLQSESAKKMLDQFKFSCKEIESVVLIADGQIYFQSTAVLKILKHLNGWKIFYFLVIVPRFMRDFVYRLVAKNRYTLFGKRDGCMVPTPGLKNRFID